MDRKFAQFLLKKTQADYNLIAEDFSRTRKKMWPEIKFLIDDYVRTEEKILDLGCGNGRLFEFLKDKNVDYFGVDFSEKLIEIAKKRFPAAKFQVADALNLPFLENTFDKVYSIAVLHHIPSQNFRLKFLKEAKRVLKPNGFLILTVWRFHQPKEIFLLLKYSILKIIGKSKLDFKDIFEPWGKKIKRYYHCFSKRELVKLIEKVNLKVIETGLAKNEKGNRQNIYVIAQKI